MLKHILVIGGGTGSYVTLIGLKHHASRVKLSAIVTVADSGGSAKQERDEFGLLPVSDVRKALLALAAENDRRAEVLRELFNYRFVRGWMGVQGGTFGNLFLVALTEILGSEVEAIKEAEMILQAAGSVVPVALKSSNLVMEYANGQVVVGEHYLDDFPGDGTKKVERAYLLPPIEANPEALSTIADADYIVLPPGDLYASVLVNMMVTGILEAVLNSKAKLIYIVNLMTKYGQTYGLSARDHVGKVENFIGRNIDYVILHQGDLPAEVLIKYAEEKDFPVVDDFETEPRVVRRNMVDSQLNSKQAGDMIKRSLLRHDPDRLAAAIMEIVEAN